MKKYDVIIIGAGPAGIITGVTAKKQNPEKSMLMLMEEDKGLVPCGIPYVFHKLQSVDDDIMGPKSFIGLGGEVKVDTVTDIDLDSKIVVTKSEEKYEFEKLVFATGSTPVIPTFIKGYDLENIFYIKKSYNYISKLYEELKDKKNIVVVGGGFIGAEVAEQLALNENKNVTLIESEENCFSKAFSSELSKIATETLSKTKVNVLTSTRLNEVKGVDGRVSSVVIADKEIEADAVIMAIGYKPNTELAKKAGLELNKIGAIITDNYERTGVKCVCAVGDCSKTIGFLTGAMDYIMLASTATAEARVLGNNLFGIKVKKNFVGTLAVFSTEINNVAFAAAGVNDNNAAMANIEYVSAQFVGVDRHPGTIDDSSSLGVKLYASPVDGVIIGGEVWGGKSAGEMINTISLAIQKCVTVYELISFQVGSHPLLTTAPTKTLMIKAAEGIIGKLRK
ncbi:MAG: FAD-dependent oxidoreductase [Bacteroidales bacterium]|jgi:NADH oxidase (H2O2-forming)|nr:FAD-dependent oxidoreductase [Bacteroidales bacterium]